MRTIVILFTLLLVGHVHADEVTWTWNAPTDRIDGTPLDFATEGAGYHVWFDGVQEMDSNGDPLLLSVGPNNLTKAFPAGEICAKLTAVDLEGRESGFSNEACATVVAPPGAPSNVTVTVVISMLLLD